MLLCTNGRHLLNLTAFSAEVTYVQFISHKLGVIYEQVLDIGQRLSDVINITDVDIEQALFLFYQCVPRKPEQSSNAAVKTLRIHVC